MTICSHRKKSCICAGMCITPSRSFSPVLARTKLCLDKHSWTTDNRRARIPLNGKSWLGSWARLLEANRSHPIDCNELCIMPFIHSSVCKSSFAVFTQLKSYCKHIHMVYSHKYVLWFINKLHLHLSTMAVETTIKKITKQRGKGEKSDYCVTLKGRNSTTFLYHLRYQVAKD